MRSQWALLLGLLFAIIVAVFAIFNVERVPVNYVFGTSEWPLILVILVSALLGAAISGFIAMFRSVAAQRKIRRLERDIQEKEVRIANQQNELANLKSYATAFEDEAIVEGTGTDGELPPVRD